MTELSKLSLNNSEEIAYTEAYMKELDELVTAFAMALDYNIATYVVIDPELSESMVYQSVAILEDSGEGYFILPDQLPKEYFDENDLALAWYYEPFNMGHGIWSNVYEDPTIGDTLITYSTPLIVNETIVGVVGVDLSFDVFAEIINSISVYDSGYAYLINSDYYTLVHPVFTPEQRLDEVEDGKFSSLIDAINEQGTGYSYYTINGVEKINGFMQIINGWIVGVSPPMNEVFASLNTLIVSFYWVNKYQNL